MSVENDGGANRRRIHLREITGGEEDAPLETVGQDLRAARVRRGDELAEVSRNLKIRKDHLAALEEDRVEDLPGKTYAIGFVRSYARYLGLDDAHYVERFKQEISGRGEDLPLIASAPPEDERRWPISWRLVGGLVILLLAYGAWHLFAGSGESGQPVPPPPDLNPPKVATTPKPAPPAPSPSQTAVPSPAIDAAGSRPGGAQAPASAVPSPAIGASGAAVPAGPGKVYGQQNVNSRVILHARAATHLEVIGPADNIFIDRTLEAGDSYQVPNLPGLVLATTDAGAVEVTLDGASLGRAGRPQQILGRVSLDPQSLVDRFHNH